MINSPKRQRLYAITTTNTTTSTGKFNATTTTAH